MVAHIISEDMVDTANIMESNISTRSLPVPGSLKVPGRYLKRTFSIKIPRGARSDLERFLERISEAIHSYGASLRIDGDRLIIEVYGERSMIMDSWLRIKRIVADYSKLGKSYPPRILYKDVGLAIPLDVLAEVLSLSGYRAAVENGELMTNAPYDTVISYAQAVKDALEGSKLIYATRTAKKLIVAASAYSALDPQRVIEAALNAGLMTMNDDGKLELLKPWREAVRELVRGLGHEYRG